MLMCRRRFSPLQRRFTGLFSFTLIATAVLFGAQVSFMEGHLGFHSKQSVASISYLFSLLPAIPFLGMMLLIPRYLSKEKDEFVRTLVTQALLWGFAVPMVIDTIWGFLWVCWPVSALPGMIKVLPMLNVDLFCIATMFALSFEVRRYQ
jgi:hypothetical protein